MIRFLNKLILISLSSLFLISANCSRNDGPEKGSVLGVDPIWATKICPSGGIYNRGLLGHPQYKGNLLFHTTLKQTGMDEDNRLCALDVETGELKWMFPSDPNVVYNKQFAGRGYIHENRMIVKSVSQADRPEELICFDLDTREVLWTRDFYHLKENMVTDVIGFGRTVYFAQFQQPPNQMALIYSADIFTGDTVRIFKVSPTEKYPKSLPRGKLMLIDTETDSPKLIFFTFETKDSENNEFHNFLNILDLNTCALIKKIELEHTHNVTVSTGTLLLDRRVYFSLSSYTYCIDVDSGDIVWRTTDSNPQAWASQMTYSNGVIFMCGPNDYVAFDVETGKELYSKFVGGYWAYAHGDYVYYHVREGYIYILELKTGKSVNKLTVPETPPHNTYNVACPPTIYGDRLYVMSHSTAYCYPVYPWEK